MTHERALVSIAVVLALAGAGVYFYVHRAQQQDIGAQLAQARDAAIASATASKKREQDATDAEFAAQQSVANTLNDIRHGVEGGVVALAAILQVIPGVGTAVGAALAAGVAAESQIR